MAFKLKRQKNDNPDEITEPLWTKNFSIIWIMNLTLVGWAFMLTAPFPFYIMHLGGDELLAGLTVSGFAIASLIMRPLAGWILDNKSRSGLLRLCMVLLLLCSLLYMISPILLVAVVLRISSGFLFSGVTTSTHTNAADIIPAKRFGEGIGLLGMGNTIATAVGPAIGLMLIADFGFNSLFIICTVVVLIAIILERSLKYSDVKKTKKAATADKVTTTEQIATPEKTEKEADLENSAKKEMFRLRALFHKDAVPASVVAMFTAAPFAGISTFIALYGQIYGIGSGGIYFALIAAGTGSTRVLAGRVVDAIGEKPIILTGNIFHFLSLLLLWPQTSALYYLSGLLVGIGFGFTNPAMQVMSMRIIAPEKRGSATSTFQCAFDISSAMGGISAGVLVTLAGYRNMFAILSLYSVISLLIYFFWASKTPSAFRKTVAGNK